jgi:GH25 family lysozyme M1 (1,4-beta-N-acetylmuramidase)
MLGKLSRRSLFVVSAILLSTVASQQAHADNAVQIDAIGPGNRILGLDISKYQHTKNQPIDFTKMHTAGVRFLYINGGNTIEKADLEAANYYESDRAGAQQAGIYTGLYYYAHPPRTTDMKIVIANAHNQAKKVIDRIQGDGGYNTLDMPIALDIETNCTSLSKSGICHRSMSNAYLVRWVKTWLSDVQSALGKTPVIYSYMSFITSHFAYDNELAKYPIWIATARINPANPDAKPTMKSGNCPVSPWTDTKCNVSWKIWQYSSGGAGARYGLQPGPVDLNVLDGASENFYSLIAPTQA